MDPRKPFLTAEWRHLLMLNYAVPEELLTPYVPKGTMLDTWQGATYASVVGFQFLDTRVCGWGIPLHRNFEELNLLFYVRRFADGEWRRGVVFIKEIVPRRAIAGIARTLYNENYFAMPMRHNVQVTGEKIQVVYEWKMGGEWQRLSAFASGQPTTPKQGSLEEFITEHYWGYARQKDARCIEYQVEHPAWRVWRAEKAKLECDVAAVYGEAFAASFAAGPNCAFIAEGSAVKVFRGEWLT